MMKSRTPLMTGALLGLLAVPFAVPVHAADADWKRGRVYYRFVCTDCHKQQPGGEISPTSRTMAEWKAYFAAGKHEKGKNSLRHFVSKSYRESIKGKNQAAAKFIDVPEEELWKDVQALAIRAAKDGDAPAKCN
jgi:hypothetical protein